MTPTIEEMNRAIAEFMGFKKKLGSLNHFSVPKGEDLKYRAFTLDLKNMPYHSSWEWLMPVIEKIPALNPDKGRVWFKYEISPCYCRIESNGCMEWKDNSVTTIDAVYRTVYNFITWYNQQHTTKQ